MPPRIPSLLEPDIPTGLEAICMACLRKDPRDRYPTAAGPADDLNRFLGQGQVRTPPGRRRLWALTAAGAVLLLGLVFTGAWLLTRDWNGNEPPSSQAHPQPREPE